MTSHFSYSYFPGNKTTTEEGSTVQILRLAVEETVLQLTCSSAIACQVLCHFVLQDTSDHANRKPLARQVICGVPYLRWYFAAVKANGCTA